MKARRANKKLKRDLTGVVLADGNVVVESRAPSVYSGSQLRTMWNCRCGCGKLFTAMSTNLICRKVVSCGCSHARAGKYHYNWKGYRGITGQYFHQTRSGATARSIPFEITIEDMWNVFENQNGMCALSGIPIALATEGRRAKGFSYTASIDRIDSALGYTPDNIQWVHKHINRMKNHYTDQYFVKICKLVAAHKSQ